MIGWPLGLFVCGNDASMTIDDDCGTSDEGTGKEGGFVLILRPAACAGGWV